MFALSFNYVGQAFHSFWVPTSSQFAHHFISHPPHAQRAGNCKSKLRGNEILTYCEYNYNKELIFEASLQQREREDLGAEVFDV